jgi:pSer/pThr/pTyr-binding forkhead associated (FHA) protein
MAELLVSRKDGELLLTVDLTGRSKLTLGRSPRCDLTLDAASISRRHALLIDHAGSWILLDTGSSTGIFNGEERTRCLQLAEGQWARIGPAYLWIDGGTDAAASGNAAAAGIEASAAKRMPDPTPRSEAPAQDPLLAALAPEPSQPPDSPGGAVLLVTDLGGALIERRSLTAREKFTVGRSKRCDLTLADPAVSRLHCVLYLEGKRWCVADADSSGGTRVEGCIAHRRRLEDHMLIRVGGYLLRVEGSRRGSGGIEGEGGVACPVGLSAFLGRDGLKRIQVLSPEEVSRPVRRNSHGEARRAGNPSDH